MLPYSQHTLASGKAQGRNGKENIVSQVKLLLLLPALLHLLAVLLRLDPPLLLRVLEEVLRNILAAASKMTVIWRQARASMKLARTEAVVGSLEFLRKRSGGRYTRERRMEVRSRDRSVAAKPRSSDRVDASRSSGRNARSANRPVVAISSNASPRREARSVLYRTRQLGGTGGRW
jgi:hypothetical protein